jgi:hypothetical protein
MPHDDILFLNLIARLCVELAILDPVAGLLVDLVESDLLLPRGRWEKLDRTRTSDKRRYPFQ